MSQLAEEMRVCWWTIMNAVVEQGTPLVDDPDRVGPVSQREVDETSFFKATRHHPILFATSMVELQEHIVLDMVEGNRADDLRQWTEGAHPDWLAGIAVAADPTESFRAGVSPHLDHASPVADPFHVVRVANRGLDTVRRRVQNETLGHRGRKHDPLYRARRLLTKADERLDDRGRTKLLGLLDAGDPRGEVRTAWHAEEVVRSIYDHTDPSSPTSSLPASDRTSKMSPARRRSLSSAAPCCGGRTRSSPGTVPTSPTARPKQSTT